MILTISIFGLLIFIGLISIAAELKQIREKMK